MGITLIILRRWASLTRSPISRVSGLAGFLKGLLAGGRSSPSEIKTTWASRMGSPLFFLASLKSRRVFRISQYARLISVPHPVVVVVFRTYPLKSSLSLSFSIFCIMGILGAESNLRSTSVSPSCAISTVVSAIFFHSGSTLFMLPETSMASTIS